jgi:hypothetical protein
LKQLGTMAMLPWLLSGCRSGPSLEAARTLAAAEAGRRVYPDWQGASPGPMHRIRDQQLPLPLPDRVVETVIVGGGITGLTVAHQLNNANWLLLERENRLGGNAKSGQFQGMDYAQGAAYFVDTSAPFDRFYADLGVPCHPLPDDAQWIQTASGQLMTLDASSLQGDMARFKSHLRGLKQQDDCPGQSVNQVRNTRLDSITAWAYLKNDYGLDFLTYVDHYCHSSLGGGIHQVSAYAMLGFLVELIQPTYALPGGKGYIARRLADRIGPERIQTGVSVYRVQVRPNNRVWVSYFHNATPNDYHTVEAKAAVLATPYAFSARLMPEAFSHLNTLRYGSYVVANVMLNQRQPLAGYDMWSLDAQRPYTDWVDATYCMPEHGRQNTAQVLTVYAPLKQASDRARLLTSTPQAWGTPLLQALPVAMESVVGVEMTRFGHQVLTAQPGLVRRMQHLKKQVGPVLLAHSDGQAAPAIESAILEGLTASQALKRMLAPAARIAHA